MSPTVSLSVLDVLYLVPLGKELIHHKFVSYCLVQLRVFMSYSLVIATK